MIYLEMDQMLSENYENLISDFDRFFILTVLYEGPTHGYSILRKFKNRLKKKGSPGIVYPFLQLLEEKGLVTYQKELHGDRERKVYALSPKGRKFCERLFKRFSSIVSTAIEPGLEKCAHCGCILYEGGYQEFLVGVELMFCCSHCARSYKMDRGPVIDSLEANEPRNMVK
jgi:DNA-binding PadR family transcriptional regulator